MAECTLQRTLTASGQVNDNIVDSGKSIDINMLDDTSETDQDIEAITVSHGYIPQNEIYPSIDHSYVSNVKKTASKLSSNISKSYVDMHGRNFIQSDLKLDESLESLTGCDETAILDSREDLQSDLISFANQEIVNIPNFESTCENDLSKASTIVDNRLIDSDNYVKKSPSAPLGSVQNPIQIVQQGNAYRSSQVLTKDHMKQIAHVLQQQQLNKAVQNGGKSVLFDQATNTRIICKVIYPSEIQNKSNDANTSEQILNKCGKGRPKKGLVMRKTNEEERGKLVLSREEREEKKKHRPRTRSGRISKPPSYMVKDYKRIHHLDFNDEPYDDSDGGYSDYHVSDEEKEKYGNKGSASDPTAAKKRSFVCGSCSKAYIGKGGLSRHYRFNPSHGNMPEGEDVSTQDENSNSSSVFSMPGSSAPGTFNISPVSRTEADMVQIQPSFALQDFLSNKRKNKLKDVLKRYRDDEIAEVVLPRLSSSISLWDFLLAKAREGNTQQVDIATLFSQFENILTQMQQVTRNCLSSTALANDIGKSLIHITNENLAQALSISTGSYFVKDLNKPSDSFCSSNLKSIDIESTLVQHSALISPTDVLTPAKLRKIHSVIEEPIHTLPDQILNEVQEVVGMELNLPSVEFDGTTDVPSQILQAIHEDNQDITTRTFFSEPCSNSSNHRLLQIGSNTTTVTPSSLSSGCLSAVDASEALRTHAFMTASTSNQLNEVPMYTASLQNFQTESQPFESANSNNVVNVSQAIIVSNTDRSLLNFSDQSLGNVPSQGNSSIFCGDMQQASTIDFSSQAALSLLQGNAVNDIPAVPNCLVESEDGMCNQNSVIVDGAMENIQTISANNAVSFETANTCDSESSFHINTIKPTANNSIIRQLILPRGQVVESWSELQNQVNMSYNDQLLSEHMSNNLVLIQNPDGSYQVPQDQIVPLETLQALLNATQTNATQLKDGDSPSELL